MTITEQAQPIAVPGDKPENVEEEIVVSSSPSAAADKPDPTSSFTYLQPLSFCTVLVTRPCHVLWQNLTTVLTIALLASGLRYLMAFVFDVVNGDEYGADYGTTSTTTSTDYSYSSYQQEEGNEQETSLFYSFATWFMAMVNGLILFVVMCLADGAIIYVVAQFYAQKDETSTTAISRSLSIGGKLSKAVVAIGSIATESMLPLMLACLVVTSAFVIAVFVVMVAAGIIYATLGGDSEDETIFIVMVLVVLPLVMVYVSAVTYLMYPAIVVERKGMEDGIKRSFELTRRYLCTILAVFLFYGLLKMALGTLVALLTVYETPAATVMYGILSFCLNTFFLALGAIVKSVVYFDIRCKEEQLSQGMLQMELGLLTAKATPYAAMEDRKDVSSEKDQDAKLDPLV